MFLVLIYALALGDTMNRSLPRRAPGSVVVVASDRACSFPWTGPNGVGPALNLAAQAVPTEKPIGTTHWMNYVLPFGPGTQAGGGKRHTRFNDDHGHDDDNDPYDDRGTEDGEDDDDRDTDKQTFLKLTMAEWTRIWDDFIHFLASLTRDGSTIILVSTHPMLHGVIQGLGYPLRKIQHFHTVIPAPSYLELEEWDVYYPPYKQTTRPYFLPLLLRTSLPVASPNGTAPGFQCAMGVFGPSMAQLNSLYTGAVAPTHTPFPIHARGVVLARMKDTVAAVVRGIVLHKKWQTFTRGSAVSYYSSPRDSLHAPSPYVSLTSRGDMGGSCSKKNVGALFDVRYMYMEVRWVVLTEQVEWTVVPGDVYDGIDVNSHGTPLEAWDPTCDWPAEPKDPPAPIPHLYASILRVCPAAIVLHPLDPAALRAIVRVPLVHDSDPIWSPSCTPPSRDSPDALQVHSIFSASATPLARRHASHRNEYRTHSPGNLLEKAAGHTEAFYFTSVVYTERTQHGTGSRFGHALLMGRDHRGQSVAIEYPVTPATCFHYVTVQVPPVVFPHIFTHAWPHDPLLKSRLRLWYEPSRCTDTAYWKITHLTSAQDTLLDDIVARLATVRCPVTSVDFSEVHVDSPCADDLSTCLDDDSRPLLFDTVTFCPADPSSTNRDEPGYRAANARVPGIITTALSIPGQQWMKEQCFSAVCHLLEGTLAPDYCAPFLAEPWVYRADLDERHTPFVDADAPYVDRKVLAPFVTPASTSEPDRSVELEAARTQWVTHRDRLVKKRAPSVPLKPVHVLGPRWAQSSSQYESWFAFDMMVMFAADKDAIFQRCEDYGWRIGNYALSSESQLLSRLNISLYRWSLCTFKAHWGVWETDVVWRQGRLAGNFESKYWVVREGTVLCPLALPVRSNDDVLSKRESSDAAERRVATLRTEPNVPLSQYVGQNKPLDTWKWDTENDLNSSPVPAPMFKPVTDPTALDLPYQAVTRVLTFDLETLYDPKCMIDAPGSTAVVSITLSLDQALSSHMCRERIVFSVGTCLVKPLLVEDTRKYAPARPPRWCFPERMVPHADLTDDDQLYRLMERAGQLGNEADAAVDAVHVFSTEKAMLLAFVELVQDLDTDILLGHNSIDFDIRCLEARCQLYQIPLTLGRLCNQRTFVYDSTVQKSSRKSELQPGCGHVHHRMVWDSMQIAIKYPDYFDTPASNSLDNLARQILGDHKIGLKYRWIPLYHASIEGRTWLLRYNVQDTDLTIRLILATDVLNTFTSFARECGYITPEQIISQGVRFFVMQWFASIMDRVLHNAFVMRSAKDLSVRERRWNETMERSSYIDAPIERDGIPILDPPIPVRDTFLRDRHLFMPFLTRQSKPETLAERFASHPEWAYTYIVGDPYFHSCQAVREDDALFDGWKEREENVAYKGRAQSRVSAFFEVVDKPLQPLQPPPLTDRIAKVSASTDKLLMYRLVYDILSGCEPLDKKSHYVTTLLQRLSILPTARITKMTTPTSTHAVKTTTTKTKTTKAPVIHRNLDATKGGPPPPAPAKKPKQKLVQGQTTLASFFSRPATTTTTTTTTTITPTPTPPLYSQRVSDVVCTSEKRKVPATVISKPSDKKLCVSLSSNVPSVPDTHRTLDCDSDSDMEEFLALLPEGPPSTQRSTDSDTESFSSAATFVPPPTASTTDSVRTTPGSGSGSGALEGVHSILAKLGTTETHLFGCSDLTHLLAPIYATLGADAFDAMLQVTLKTRTDVDSTTAKRKLEDGDTNVVDKKSVKSVLTHTVAESHIDANIPSTPAAREVTEWTVSRLRSMKIHSKTAKDKDEKSYGPNRTKNVGGAVLEADAGIHNDGATVLDFNSLYPSCKRSFNLSGAAIVDARTMGPEHGLHMRDVFPSLIDPYVLQNALGIHADHQLCFVNGSALDAPERAMLNYLAKQRNAQKKRMKQAKADAQACLQHAFPDEKLDVGSAAATAAWTRYVSGARPEDAAGRVKLADAYSAAMTSHTLADASQKAIKNPMNSEYGVSVMPVDQLIFVGQYNRLAGFETPLKGRWGLLKSTHLYQDMYLEFTGDPLVYHRTYSPRIVSLWLSELTTAYPMLSRLSRPAGVPPASSSPSSPLLLFWLTDAAARYICTHPPAAGAGWPACLWPYLLTVHIYIHGWEADTWTWPVPPGGPPDAAELMETHALSWLRQPTRPRPYVSWPLYRPPPLTSTTRSRDRICIACYGDTDSVFIEYTRAFCPTLDHAYQLGQAMTQLVNVDLAAVSDHSCMALEFEYMFSSLILLKKKNYYGRVYTPGKGVASSVITKGVRTKKSDTSPLYAAFGELFYSVQTNTARELGITVARPDALYAATDLPSIPAWDLAQTTFDIRMGRLAPFLSSAWIPTIAAAYFTCSERELTLYTLSAMLERYLWRLYATRRSAIVPLVDQLTIVKSYQRQTYAANSVPSHVALVERLATRAQNPVITPLGDSIAYFYMNKGDGGFSSAGKSVKVNIDIPSTLMHDPAMTVDLAYYIRSELIRSLTDSLIWYVPGASKTDKLHVFLRGYLAWMYARVNAYAVHRAPLGDLERVSSLPNVKYRTTPTARHPALCQHSRSLWTSVIQKDQRPVGIAAAAAAAAIEPALPSASVTSIPRPFAFTSQGLHVQKFTTQLTRQLQKQTVAESTAQTTTLKAGALPTTKKATVSARTKRDALAGIDVRDWLPQHRCPGLECRSGSQTTDANGCNAVLYTGSDFKYTRFMCATCTTVDPVAGSALAPALTLL